MNVDEDAPLIVDQAGPGLRVLRLNRPEKRNALATPLLRSVAEALGSAQTDESVRCVVLTGGTKVFAAGADINELAEKDVAGVLGDERPAIWARIRGFPKPLIAAVEGWCLGAGNELLMCCDLSVAGQGARFGQPETNLGIIPGAGGTATLTRLIGRTAAMRIVLLGEPVDAASALQIGLVSELVADGEAFDRAIEIARIVAGRAPLAMRQGKAMVTAGFELPHTAHLAAERQAFATLFGTSDRHEGITAFREKRAPEWTGT